MREAAMVPGHVASAFALGELRDRNLAEALAAELRGNVLLVLDNCEHLIGACAELVGGLLSGCRGLHILATSQQRLGVGGEVVWAVPPLALPQPRPEEGMEAVLLAPACSCSAIARRRSPRPSTRRPPTLQRRRDLPAPRWQPVGHRAAAARVDVLSAAHAARLEHRFDILRAGARTGPARQQTLAVALEP